MKFRNIFSIYFSIFIIICSSISLAQDLTIDQNSGLRYIIKKGTTDGPILIFIHGFGSNERDLFSFKDYFPKHATIVCPQGPYGLSPRKKSYSWYDIKFKSDGKHERNVQQANRSDSLLIVLSKSIRKQFGSDSSKIIFGGFSQGAILSFKITMEHPADVDGFIGLSGAPIEENYESSFDSLAYSHIQAFYAHGTKDVAIPYSYGLLCQKLLLATAAKLTFKTYEIGHNVSTEELIDLKEWFNANF